MNSPLQEYAEKRWPAKNGHKAGCSAYYALEICECQNPNWKPSSAGNYPSEPNPPGGSLTRETGSKDMKPKSDYVTKGTLDILGLGEQKPMTQQTPSPGALRAAEAIWKKLWGDPLNVKALNRNLIPTFASFIDEETNLPALLEALETIVDAHYGTAYHHIGDGDGIPKEQANKIRALLASLKTALESS